MNYIETLEYIPSDEIPETGALPLLASYPLFSAKCADLNSVMSHKKGYADDAYIFAYNGLETTTNIGGFALVAYKLMLRLKHSKNRHIYDYLLLPSGGDRYLLFNKDFNGRITGFSDADANDYFTIEMMVYASPKALPMLAAKTKVLLADNSIILVRDRFSQQLLPSVSINKLDFKIETATYGVFESVYNRRNVITAEFSPFRRPVAYGNWLTGEHTASRLYNGQLFYLDLLALGYGEELKKVNPVDVSEYSGTINMSTAEITKFMYIAVINKDFVKQNNSYKFKFKASLI